MKAIKKSIPQQADKVLYIGTTEQTAKLAPSRGLEPPIFLTDVYAGFFCKSLNAKRWGIISVSLNRLNQDMLAPSPAFIEQFAKKRSKNPAAIEKRRKEILENIIKYKGRWKQSLIQSGVCLYLLRLYPNCINKVMIYDAKGPDTNPVINKLVEDLPNPYETSFLGHRNSYNKGQTVASWFNGDDICDVETTIELNNHTGLEIYYLREEQKYKKAK